MEMPVEIGRKYKIFFSDNNPMNRTAHIRAFVDEHYVVYRFWKKRKDRWEYVIDSVYYFKLLLKDGALIKDGFSKR